MEKSIYQLLWLISLQTVLYFYCLGESYSLLVNLDLKTDIQNYIKNEPA